MGSILTLAQTWLRSYVTAGVPASGVNQPAKAEGLDVFEALDDIVTAVPATSDPTEPLTGQGWWRTDLPGPADEMLFRVYDGAQKLPGFICDTTNHILRIAALSIVPQGRLTLATGVPVMVSSQSAKTVVYYTPHVGTLIPIWDGYAFSLRSFAELSNDLTADSTGKAGPAAAGNSKNYDLFVWSDSDGTMRLTRGPDWTSDTARGTGAGTTELERVQGLWRNKVAITNGPAAGYGTYVGTIRTNGSAQANWIPGAIATGGTAAVLGVWNAFNRVEVRGLVGDDTNTWSYATATIRPANNSATMRVSFVVGLQEDFLEADYQVGFANDTNSHGGSAGVGYDSTTAFSGRFMFVVNGGSNSDALVAGGQHAVQPLGFHYLQALEKGTGGGTQTWLGDNSGACQNGLSYHGRF